MRVDWISASLLGDVQDVVKVFSHSLEMSEVKACRGVNGYHRGVQVTRGETVHVSIYYGGQHAEGWIHVVGTGERAPWVRQILQKHYPSHRVTRLDIAEDYRDPAAWDSFEGIVTALARKYGMGGSYRRFDGGLDHQGGRTVYLGSKHSTVQLRVYEKGKKEGLDPNWVRVELVVKPKRREAREWMATAKESEVFGCSTWSKDLGERMGVQELARIPVGTVYARTNLEKRTEALVRQYSKTLLQLLGDQCGGDPHQLGDFLLEKVEQHQQQHQREQT